MTKTGYVGTNTRGEGQRGRCVLQGAKEGPLPPDRAASCCCPGPFHGTYSQWLRQRGRCRLCGGQGHGLQSSQPGSQPNPKPARTKTRLEGEDMPAAWGRSDSTPATISVETVTCPWRQPGLDGPGETQGSGPNPR